MAYSLDQLRNKILPLRLQMQIQNDWLKQRLEQVIPVIMEREQIDLWLIIAREYNEDPVLMTLLPAPAMSARRRTILMFYRQPDGQIERLSVDRYGYEGFYTQAWSPTLEEQYACVNRLIVERNTSSIGINFSTDFAFGDGISHQEYEFLISQLDEAYRPKIVSAERLCIGWLEQRIESERIAYPSIVELGHALISEAFSRQVVHPGITSTDDVVWWFRQRMNDLGLRAWFHPTVEIQAPGQPQEFLDKSEKRKVILPGDLLHCDVGFYYLGLATDQQQHAYVLKPGEIEAPAGLKAALQTGNRLQDIHLAQMRVGQTGNEVLKAALDTASDEGIQAMIYSHPLGYHGHAAGPTIGLWDMQGGVPGKGDYRLYDNTCYSIELNIKQSVPQWAGQIVRIALEEDAILENGEIRWLHGRQTEFHLI